MYMMEYDILQYHEERTKEMARQYQNAVWQEAQLRRQVSALVSRIRSWLGTAGEGRMEPQPVRVNSR